MRQDSNRPTVEAMKKLKAEKELKVQGPPRATVSEKQALERMKQFSKRKGAVPCHCSNWQQLTLPLFEQHRQSLIK